MVWRRGGVREQALPLGLFMLQLVLNGLWSWLFFAWQLGGLAMAEILVLWLAIAVTLVAFWRVSTLAGVLMVPYLAWVSFAAFLNFTLWQNNPGLLG